MSTPLFLIRHTRVAIASGVCYGQLDVGLAESFAKEALAISRKIEKYSFAATYSSPLQRCILLAQTLNLRPKTDSRLMEMDFGQWEGETWETIYASPYGKHWFNDYWAFPCPDGESFQELIARVESFLQELEIASVSLASKPSCIVTHAGVIRAILVLLCGLDPASAFDIQIPYGQIISIHKGRSTFL